MKNEYQQIHYADTFSLLVSQYIMKSIYWRKKVNSFHDISIIISSISLLLFPTIFRQSVFPWFFLDFPKFPDLVAAVAPGEG